MAQGVRRVVTGHDVEGIASIQIDDRITLAGLPDGTGSLAPLWATARIPADNQEPALRAWDGIPPILGRGSALWIVELAPGGASPPHRTQSIDYGIVLSGDVELELAAGRQTLLTAGDVIVQRGTVHAWRNPSATKRCRLAFVLVEARPFYQDGQPLPELQPVLD